MNFSPDFNTFIRDFIVAEDGVARYITDGFSRRDRRTVKAGLPKLLNKAENYASIFHNIFGLAFMYAFSCYQDLASREEDCSLIHECLKNGNANSKRVIRTMQKIYGEYTITDDLIKYVLTDIYFDDCLGKDSKLREYFPECISSSATTAERLRRLFEISDTYSSTRSDFFDSGDGVDKMELVMEYLEEMFRIFPFLRTARLVFDEKRKWYLFDISATVRSSEKFKKRIVNTFGTITRIDYDGGSDFYYLSEINPDSLRYARVGVVDDGSTNCIVCPLKGFSHGADNGYGTGIITAPYELPIQYRYVCAFLCPDRLEGCAAEEEHTLNKLFNINYKYLKTLSLAISDALGKNDYIYDDVLEGAFEKKYPHVFAKVAVADKGAGESDKPTTEYKMHRDARVLMLLLEEGPSTVLQRLIYNDLCKKRLDDPHASSWVCTQVIDNLMQRTAGERTVCDSLARLKTEAIRNAKNSVRLRLMKGKPPETDAYKALYWSLVAEAMTSSILSVLVKNNGEESEAEPKFSFSIADTAQYRNAVEALKSKSLACDRLAVLKNVIGDLMGKIACFYEGVLAYGERKRVGTAEAEVAFVAAARAKWELIRGCSDTAGIIGEFLATCKKCYSVTNTVHTMNSESRHLTSAVGKAIIIDTELFERETFPLPELNEVYFDDWIEIAEKLIGFLCTGSFDGKRQSADIFTTVIPFIASCTRRNDSKDGYQTSTFTFLFEGNKDVGEGKSVSVLTEASCNMTSKYYCLPNVGCSTEKWWIDPFIIECRLFDDVFEKENK